jgi:uncharacterized membrane protein
MNFQSIIKKWYVILICAIVCASGLYFEKSQIHTVVPQTGDMTYIRVVRFNTVPVFTANQTSTEIDVTNLMKAWSNLTELNSQIEENFDMNKMNADWNKISDSQKVKWLGEHFRVQNMGPGLYELIIQFTKQDAKDSQYIKENRIALMNLYENHFLKMSTLVTKDTSLSTVKELQNINEDKIVSKENIEKKYAVIGFILGALVGVVIVMAWNAKKHLVKH